MLNARSDYIICHMWQIRKVAPNYNDEIKSCDLFKFIAQLWLHWKPQISQKNSSSPHSSIYSSSIRMTSPPCNECEQIMPSFLFCVNYCQSNHMLNIKNFDYVPFNCVEFPCYTPEVIACNNRTYFWATLDQPDNELSNFTRLYVTCDRSRNKLHQIIMHCMPNLTDVNVYHIISMWHFKNWLCTQMIINSMLCLTNRFIKLEISN